METTTQNEKPVPLRAVGCRWCAKGLTSIRLDELRSFHVVFLDLTNYGNSIFEPCFIQQRKRTTPHDLGCQSLDEICDNCETQGSHAWMKHHPCCLDPRVRAMECDCEKAQCMDKLEAAALREPTEDRELQDTMLDYKRRLEDLTTLCERRGLRVGFGDKGEVTLGEAV